MTRSSGETRLRLTVEGVDEAVFEWMPEDAPPPAGRVPDVRQLPPTSGDRAAGRSRYEVTIDGWVLRVGVESARLAALRERAGQGAERSHRAGRSAIRAQIPGRVARVWVAEGDTVEAGQRLLAIEAMKMENEVRAPQAGTVEAVTVAAGDSVELGDELLTIA